MKAVDVAAVTRAEGDPIRVSANAGWQSEEDRLMKEHANVRRPERNPGPS